MVAEADALAAIVGTPVDIDIVRRFVEVVGNDALGRGLCLPEKRTVEIHLWGISRHPGRCPEGSQS